MTPQEFKEHYRAIEEVPDDNNRTMFKLQLIGRALKSAGYIKHFEADSSDGNIEITLDFS